MPGNLHHEAYQTLQHPVNATTAAKQKYLLSHRIRCCTQGSDSSHAMVRYTSHAKDRMRQRRITEQEVEYCLLHYHTWYTDRAGNPIYKAQLPNGRTIKVVLKSQSTDPVLVITVAD
ncbi:MAG: DUF4258 domain-containing protein [Chloroflexota bacterium]